MLQTPLFWVICYLYSTAMSSLAKRFGFAKKPVLAAESNSPESASTDNVKGADEKEDVAAVATGINDRRISEVEANRTLRHIQRTHRWDPNLPEAKTEEHNLAGELRLVDELVENSPYPEVRAAVRNVSRPLTPPLTVTEIVT